MVSFMFGNIRIICIESTRSAKIQVLKEWKGFFKKRDILPKMSSRKFMEVASAFCQSVHL